MADGCVRGISLVLWISRTSGRSFVRFDVVAVRVSELTSCSILARGSVERSGSSTSISLDETEEVELAESLLWRFAGLEWSAHSGTGFRRSNCLRSRLEYSLPLTTSSASLIRSFRSRGLPARETASRSSSLSSQGSGSSPASSSFWATGVIAFPPIAEGPASRKKSFLQISRSASIAADVY